MSPSDSLRGIKNKPEYQALETQRFIRRHSITKFRTNPFFPVNTLMLMRGAVAAQFEGVFEPYFRAAYHHMTLMVGATVRLVSKYDPAALTKAMAEEGITILNGVPATYQRLLEYKTVAGLTRLDRGSLRLIAVAGAPLDLELKSRVERELGLPLSNGYGITECSPGISGVRFDEPRSDQAVGTLLPGVEARIRTVDGIPVAKGEIGELHVRGRNVMSDELNVGHYFKRIASINTQYGDPTYHLMRYAQA